MRRFFLWLIRVYQTHISSHTPPQCRFYPTCSHYTYEAIERFGVFRGLLLGGWRLLRCNPWNPGGFDPVPEKKSKRISYKSSNTKQNISE